MSLTRRLVVDTARRMLALYALAGFMVFALSLMNIRSTAEGYPIGKPSDLLAWPLAACWFLAYSPTLLMEAREVTRLPVSRREIWIARWCMAVCAPAAVIAIALGAAMMLSGSRPDAERFALVIMFGALYGGCFAAAAAIFPLGSMTPVMKPKVADVIRIVFLVGVIPLGGAALPLWFAKYLPQTFGQIRGPFMGWLIAAAGVTLASYFYRPAIVARPSRPTLQAAAPATTRRTGIGDELTGLRFLFFKEARKMLLIYSTLLALTIVYWMIFESVSLAEFLRVSSALIFAGLPTLHESEFPVIMMFFVVAASDLALMGNMRSYRALPISVNRLSAILTGLNILTALLMWIVLLAAHIIAVGAAPQTLRPDLFLVVAGGLAMSETLQLTLPLEGPFRIMVGGILLAPMLVVFRMTYAASAPWAHAAMIAGGGAALCLSWLLNRRALSRGRRIYKMKSPLASFLPENGR